jgi:hypothetical protein
MHPPPPFPLAPDALLDLGRDPAGQDRHLTNDEEEKQLYRSLFPFNLP